MAVDITIGMARRVGFLEVSSEGVELHNLSLCSGGVASTCRAVQETSFWASFRNEV